MSVGEGNGRVEVCATLSGAEVATERDFMITLATSDGTALGKYIEAILYTSSYDLYSMLRTAGSDFDDTSMDLTFSSGASDGDTKCLAVTITDDDALEAEESFSVALTVSDDDVKVIANITTLTITGIVALVSLTLSLVLFLHQALHYTILLTLVAMHGFFLLYLHCSNSLSTEVSSHIIMQRLDSK